MLSVKAFAHGIQRTRPDVAVNDPKAGETEQSEPTPAMLGGGKRRRNADRIGNGAELKMGAQNSPFLRDFRLRATPE